MNRQKRESLFERLNRARSVLELPERVSIKRIKEQYRELSKTWHPDICKEKPAACQRMQQRLNEAYSVLMGFCNNYEYSFRREDVEKYPTGEDFWWEHYGDI
ncbi:MAG: J domain-containing protein [Gemmatimonadota bacterium]|nr:J domain-containing protein [Gemmatimonadota bacterium]